MTRYMPSIDALLPNIPQIELIQKRIPAWLENLKHASSGLTIEQHIQRLGGFGGSEIGVLVAERRGEVDPFTTAREICQSKLLLGAEPPPDPYQLGDMARGRDLEPVIRDYFHQMTGATPLPDEIQKLSQHQHHTHPWMGYTPDDIVQLHGQTILVDYKAPFKAPTDVAFRYGCQLHQGRLLAEDAGIKIDKMMMVAWDLQNWQPLIFLTEHDPQLDHAIKAAGDHFWHYVQAGKLPPWPTRPSLQNIDLADLDDANREQVKALSYEYAQLDILAKEAKKMADAAKQKLEQLSLTLNLSDTQAGAVDVKPVTRWNAEAIQARLPEEMVDQLTPPQWDGDTLAQMVQQLGGDPSSAQKQGKFDVNAAAEWLVKHHNIPVEQLQTEAVKIGVSRRKADAEMTAPLRQAADASIAQIRSPISIPSISP